MADLLTTRQVQALLKIDRTTIYRMVESGQLPAIRVGKQWRFVRADLDQLLTTTTAIALPVATKTGTAVRATALPANADLPLHELLPLTVAQLIQDFAADALGVTMVVTDMQGQPITTVSNPCGLYRTLLADAEAVTHCIQEWQRLAGVVTLEPKFLPNDIGLLCARSLIRAGNHLKGMVFFGGIAPDQWPPDAAGVTAIATRFQLPPALLTPQIDAVYYLDRRQRDVILGFAQRIADIFALLLEEGSISNDAKRVAI